MRKIIVCFLVFVLMFSCCGGALAATEDMMRASLTLTSTNASISTGANTGEVVISYRVRASKTASSLGVSSIALYKDGNYVTTIYGSTSNGLMSNSTTYKSGSYTYKGTSGASYYALVTMSATAGGESDSDTVRTNTARAK